MRVAIIGSGGIAKQHGPVILKQPGAQLVGIADISLQQAKALASKLKVDEVYEDAKVMIDEQKPDIVHVLVPPQHHAELSIMAMNHKCHVIVEKPMALTVVEAEEMVEAAKRNNVYLCVDHNALFENVAQRALKLISNGAIGELVSIEAYECYDVTRKPALIEKGAEDSHWTYRMNGGPLQDMLPHPISLVLEFIPEVKEIQWMGLNRGILPKPWDDEIRVLVKSDRVTGYMSVSLSQSPPICSLILYGTKGVVNVDYHNLILTLRKNPGRLPRRLSRALDGVLLGLQYFKGSVENMVKVVTGRLDQRCGIETCISRFYEAVRTGGEPPVSLNNSLRVVDLMNRIWPVPVKIANDG